jgi:hypothetical protein
LAPPLCRCDTIADVGRLLLPLLGLTAAALAQIDLAAEDYHVYRDGPRLFLTQQRLRLLERERERRSLRWEAFEPFVAGGVPLPEPGFALALYYRAARDQAAGRRAVEWALSPAAADLRQLALVFDWCGPLLGPDQDRLASKIQQAMAAPANDLPGQTARALAAIALADRLEDAGNSVLRAVVVDWWGGQIVPRLRAGEAAIPREHLYALLELMHALRDNTRVDLRASAPEYFENLPLSYLAAHYPAPLAAPEGQYRIPAYLGEGPPDLEIAARSRAAGLALVAFDTNAVNHQYVQGWLMLDRFALRTPFGSPYEFLWANPYQPGLSYQTLSEVFHNPITGEVFARTSWDDDATWIGYFDGRLQMFRDGAIQTLRAGADVPALRVGSALIAGAASRQAARLRIDAGTLFVLGLEPRAEYGIEIDDQELTLASTDAGGTLVVTAPEGIDAGVRLHRRP